MRRARPFGFGPGGGFGLTGFGVQALSLCVLALSGIAHADPPRAPGPGDPLPPIRLDYSNGDMETRIGPNGVKSVVATGGVLLVYGDLQIRADHIEFTADGLQIQATGGVKVTRGDESLRGDAFTYSGTDGTFDLTNAVAISPPFYVSGARITRQPGLGMLATDARFVPSPDGRGEISVSAQEIQVTRDGNALIFRQMKLFVSGRRVLTVPHLRLRLIPVAGGFAGSGETAATIQIPLSVRYSGVSGVVVGINFPVVLPGGIYGSYGAAVTTHTPLQYSLNLRRDLISPETIGRARPESVLYSTPGGTGEVRYEGMSPIRQIAVARPRPPAPDPVLDYETILSNGDPVSRPLRLASRDLYLTADLIGNRDVGFKRQGALTLSRLPEGGLIGDFPLFGRLPQHATDASLRRFLRIPRFQLFGSASAGYYQEHHYASDHATISGDRQAVTVGIGTLPLLIADHLLVRPQFALNSFSYDTPRRSAYRYAESSITVDYLFAERTLLGFSLFRRDQSGSTPFTFDEVDTRNEGQLRGQLSLPGGKWTIGSALRLDLSQGHLFDTEIAAAWRGKTIEPRFSYQTLNNQFNVGINFPSLER